MNIMGFSAIDANNGKDGVERAIEDKPNLILMDIMIPGMDGRAATRIICSNPKTQNISILTATVPLTMPLRTIT